MADAATEADRQVVKLRIWARQWRGAKLAPKRYGEKSTEDVKVQHSLEDLILEARQKRQGRVIEGRAIEALPAPSSMVTKDEASAD
jgi:terminase small subunit-like protein